LILGYEIFCSEKMRASKMKKEPIKINNFNPHKDGQLILI